MSTSLGAHIGIGVHQAVGVQLVVGFTAPRAAHLHVRNLELVLLAARVLSLLGLRDAEEVAAGQAALDGAPVHDQGILNVISFISQDGHHEVLAGRPLVKAHGMPRSWS